METITKKKNLFEIDAELDQIAELVDQIEDGGDELGVAAAVTSYFGEVLDQRDDKLDAYVAFITARSNRAEMRIAEAKLYEARASELRALARTDENAATRLKRLLHDWLIHKGIQKIETKWRRIWIQGNGGKQAMTILNPNTDAWATEYLKTVTVLDTDKIRADLEAGKELPHARLEPRGSRVQFK